MSNSNLAHQRSNFFYFLSISLMTLQNMLKLDNKPKVNMISGGQLHSCAISIKQNVFCWGKDTSSEAMVPQGLHDAQISFISSGHFHNCVIISTKTKDNKILDCWGVNQQGQGDVSGFEGSDQVTMNATSVSAGSQHNCAIVSGFKLYCWGRDNEGQVSILPELATTDVLHIAAGHMQSCAIDQDLAIHCWGKNNHRQAQVDSIPLVKSYQFQNISLGRINSCATVTEGKVVCWGSGAFNINKVPDEFQQDTMRLAAGEMHVCGINGQTILKCWGGNSGGQAAVPEAFASGSKQVAAGLLHTCAVDAGDQPGCWGVNNHGQLDVPFFTDEGQIQDKEKDTIKTIV